MGLQLDRWFAQDLIYDDIIMIMLIDVYCDRENIEFIIYHAMLTW